MPGTKRWRPAVSLPCSPAEIEAVLNDSLRVLDEIGVECRHDTVRRRLGEWSGVSCSGDRARFPPARVREHITKWRAPSAASPAEGDARFSMKGCWAGLNYCDPETLDVRPATTGEAAQMARFWDAQGVTGVVPLQPGDVPPELVTLTAERIALTHSKALGGSLMVLDPEEVRFLIDMHLAAGRRYRLMEQTGISPLRFNAEALETALTFQENPDVDVGLAGFIPMAGATCPLDPRTALVQATAETIAHDILCTVLRIQGGGVGLRIEPFDFRYSTVVFGSPEWCLYRVMVIQMSEFLTGRTPRYGMFRSVAKQPDSQAACERTMSVLWQGILGARHFGAVGQLSIDEVFSPQQAIIDREILAHVERVVAGFDPRYDAGDPVRLIREGLAEGSFIALDDTARRFREFYLFPDLFRHWNVNRWRAEGARTILSQAWERVKSEIAQSTFRLPNDQEEEVNRIYEKAVRHVRR